ncbi:2'-5' RNA ligase family protein [Salinimicrobium sp. HB62]|uniref:2'-5' RNA ligase family protein n=1 Tax=Salinimicrobium sp. HB62 TaxID=3077781 RepID=UPI002D78F268|nr:2'-5' RNA ligase family protein [Salinimicrobium sp. HB62]
MVKSKTLFFAALVPPQVVKEKVRNLKLEIREKVGAAHALKLPAHITLIPPFWLQNSQEKEFLEVLRVVGDKQKSFPVELKDFGRFDQRVIFLNVVDHAPIQELHKILSQALEEILSPAKEKKLHPHVTLAARDLPRSQFKVAWERLRERKIHLSFEAKSITVFRHNGKTWDVLEEIFFNNENYS